MDIQYHMIKIDGHETLTVGGHMVTDETDPLYAWLTSAQGEKLLRVYKLDCRAITRAEAAAHLRATHARREAEGSGPPKVAVVNLKQAKEIVEKHTPGFKQFPAWPEPPAKPWNN